MALKESVNCIKKAMNYRLFLLIWLCITSCTPTEKMENNTYLDLPITPNWAEWVGKKVQFKAQLAEFETQHMLRPSLNGANSYICIEPLKSYKTIHQLLAYHSGAALLIEKYDKQTFMVQGVVGVTSGAGKGGGTHTEYYLELDFIK